MAETAFCEQHNMCHKSCAKDCSFNLLVRRQVIYSISVTLKYRHKKMLIERTNSDKIIITLPSSVDSFGLQKLIGYAKYLDATAKSKAKQSDADKLADEVNASWWSKNRKRFVK